MIDKLWGAVKGNLHMRDLVIVMAFILVAVIAFGLGRLSAILDQKVPIRIDALSAR